MYTNVGKRIVISVLLCMALLLSLCACGTSDQYADQEQFLKDMALGISKRIKKSNEGRFETDEEMYAYNLELVEIELSMIEKYENQTFENQLFNDLAHAYIHACQIQRMMASNYRITNLHDTWEAARTIRAAIITELYTHYGLPISSEEAANYSAQNSGNTSGNGEYDVTTGLMKYYDNMVTYDPIHIKTGKQQVLFKNNGIEIVLKSLEQGTDKYTVNMTISNSLTSDSVTCYLGAGSIEDYQFSLYYPWGYNWANAGKKCDTYSWVQKNDLKSIGKENFKTLSAYLFVATTDGSTIQVVARIPVTIDRSAFGS